MGEVHSIMSNDQRLELWRTKLVEAEKIQRDVEHLNLLKKRLNDERVAIFDEIETNGISRNAFKEILRQRKLDVDKREHFRRSYAEGEVANGWAQVDAFGYGDPVASIDEADARQAKIDADAAFLTDLEERFGAA